MNFHRFFGVGGVRRMAVMMFSGVSGIGSGIGYFTGLPRPRFFCSGMGYSPCCSMYRSAFLRRFLPFWNRPRPVLQLSQMNDLALPIPLW